MSDVKSKNLYELLGNTSDQDSDREPEPPTKAIDRPSARHGKRDAPKAAPAAEPVVGMTGAQPRGGSRRGGGFGGSEAAFRDRATGRTFNRDQPTGEGETGVRPGRDSGPGTRRAGRGQRGPRRGGDRHSRTGISEHPKQEGQGWGQQTGEGEWADERAGEAIANAEVKEGGFDTNPEAPVDGEGNAADDKPEEPEDSSKSYADYLAEQAAKKLEGLGLKQARAPNEGAKENKKWSQGKELSKNGDNEEYFAGQERSRRERERSAKKEFLDIDYSFKEQPRDSRGGRGGGRGAGRGRGGERGRGSDFSGRSRGRGARGRGGADGQSVAVNDESAFPSLGGK
uniref:Hyaluronan/mRNA-binding protein domain-containing protein n=1 Tax=Araucaria cunninghamii TaxID=56994 RepID=A0A0D6R7J9_ARACU